MIFSGNKTALGASTIPMAEGYDCSYGVGLALVESARNDLAVFKAMVQADYKEMAICQESTGVIQEGELSALHEAVGGGIFKKIAELFKKLVAKVKAIFHNFAAKIRGLVMKDKELVKKYQTEVLRKSGIEKLEVKWRKVQKEGHNSVEFEIIDALGEFKPSDANDYKDEVSERYNKYMKNFGVDADNTGEFVKEYVNNVLDDEETLTVGDLPNGIRGVINFLSDYEKKLTKMNSNISKTTTSLEKLVKHYDDRATAIAKASNSEDKSYKDKVYDKENKKFNDGESLTADQGEVNKANKEYEMASAYQTVMLAVMQATQQIATIEYKQNKAAFMKAITVSKKKLEESSLYAQAMAEAAEDEVDNVIQNALSDEEISDLSAASTNVLDADAKDDPFALNWEKTNNYTDDATFKTSDGSVDTCIGGGKVEESYFGGMFY